MQINWVMNNIFAKNLADIDDNPNIPTKHIQNEKHFQTHWKWAFWKQKSIKTENSYKFVWCFPNIIFCREFFRCAAMRGLCLFLFRLPFPSVAVIFVYWYNDATPSVLVRVCLNSPLPFISSCNLNNDFWNNTKYTDAFQICLISRPAFFKI